MKHRIAAIALAAVTALAFFAPVQAQAAPPDVATYGIGDVMCQLIPVLCA